MKIKISSIIASIAVTILVLSCPEPEKDNRSAIAKSMVAVSSEGKFSIFNKDGTVANTQTISPFRISNKEITRAQWRSIFGDDKDPSDPNVSGRPENLNTPVQNINWLQALAYCNKVSLAEGLTPVYAVFVRKKEWVKDPSKNDGSTIEQITEYYLDFKNVKYDDIPTLRSYNANPLWLHVEANWGANGYRLPTEAEWQWAARGADAKSDLAFSGSTKSNNIDEYAWHNLNADGRTAPVGTLKPNNLQLYDMTGNVYEWMWDKFSDSIPAGESTNYRGPDPNKETDFSKSRVLRGGDIATDPEGITLSCRASTAYGVYYTYPTVGLRLAQNN